MVRSFAYTNIITWIYTSLFYIWLENNFRTHTCESKSKSETIKNKQMLCRSFVVIFCVFVLVFDTALMGQILLHTYTMHACNQEQQRQGSGSNNDESKRLYFDMLRYHDCCVCVCDLFDNKVLWVCDYHCRHFNILPMYLSEQLYYAGVRTSIANINNRLLNC